jgi:Escherichia/Staphylococcus phage prohead protease
MPELHMELRDVSEPERLVVGVVAPYDEVTYLTGQPGGERIKRGAFKRTLKNKLASRQGIGLFRNHEHGMRMGSARTFSETETGLVGEFVVNDGPRGDEFLEECRHVVRTGRGDDGAREIIEAALGEVSMVGLPAYEGAGVLAVRNAQSLDQLLAPFLNRPEVNLDPIPPIGYCPR